MKVIRSTHHTRVAATLAATALLSLSISSAAGAATPTGPSGDAFYAPSASKIMGGKHGDPIWVRPASAGYALSNAASATTIVYKSKSLANKNIPVSGVIWVPKGTAPAGGWPVISWAHGTTGSADICAPSRDVNMTGYVLTQFNQWLAAGYAIAATDYEGLGTAGIHPYLIGHSEGRGVIDIVKAAHKWNSAISSKWVTAGHSQGGHASLFAASDAATWGAGTTFKGVVAFAPANNLKTTVIFATGAVTSPNQLSGLGALLLRSTTLADKTITMSDIMNPAALALQGQIEQRCLGSTVGVGLGATDSFGQFAPGNLMKGWNGSTWVSQPKVTKALNALDGTAINPGALKISAPVMLYQGKADGTVPAFTTETLVRTLGVANSDPWTRDPGTKVWSNSCGATCKVQLTEYDGVGHNDAVAAGSNDALAWINARFGR